MILTALRKERDDRLFLQWAAQLPIMAISGDAIGYEEYRDRVTGANIDMRPTATILAELDALEKQLEKEEA